MPGAVEEVPDSNKVFKDTVFMAKNKHVSEQWVSIKELYPDGVHNPLLPDTFTREQFGQGSHYECFMQSALSALIEFPEVIRHCFVTKKVRQDGRYTFQFFRGKEWVKVEIDDLIALEDDDVLYLQSPTEHWWPLLLEKAYAKFYTGYDNIDGCTLPETFHDLTGNPVLNIPMQAKLAKTAGVDIEDPQYWLTIGDYIRHGDYVASILTKNADLESTGMQSEQQYAILGVFCMSGSSSASNVDDVVIHLHNPFEDEEFTYSGPLNAKDSAWNPAVRAKHDVDNPRSIYMPLPHFMKIANSVQLALMSIVESDATYFPDGWHGASAGGNPTSVTWRHNPLYLVRNTGSTNVRIVAVIQQEDQRRFTGPDEPAKYVQCGIVVVRSTLPHPIPTFYVTGNNHKPIYKSLFLNSREVANTVTIPANSLCYLVPSTMNKGTEADFTLALYRMRADDYSSVSIEKLSIPGIDWQNPPKTDVSLVERGKDRIDFYVDEATDIHILMHQTKPFVNKKGGDAMTENYMGLYLYDDTDRRVGGVHAATNFREISVIERLPRSGRYAISVTCPRSKGEVPAYITITGFDTANVRVVEAPEDAHMFDDEDVIDEGDDEANADANQIDYFPINFPATSVKEMPDSNTPYEDKRFYVDNRAITESPWVHIGDLYPEGKTQPLLPDKLSRDQFEQGEHYECCCLTAFASLVDNHPDVIRNCFVSKEPRKDGRYTFQFHRYGQWVKVEIDDRIPQIDDATLYSRSPTRHWWPLLLEKAYAKFYTLYQNLDGIRQEETFHDFTGRPVLQTPADPQLAKAAKALYELQDPNFWLALKEDMPNTVVAALAHGEKADAMGLQEDQYYAILDVLPLRAGKDLTLADILVKLHNPFDDAEYVGPMNAQDSGWTSSLRSQLKPENDKRSIYVPASVFVTAFSAVNQGLLNVPVEPSWHFNSEWGDVGTNGGNPSLITWRNNPLYVVRNPLPDPVQIVAMVRQPDQRHVMHTLPETKLDYPQVGLTLATANPGSRAIPTYLVTMDNHRLTHRGVLERKREVANLVTIPPKSLNYLVGNAMSHDKSKFVLSYWFYAAEDAGELKLMRLRPDVARHLPAVTEVTLHNRGKERVDFLVEKPTNIHILLRQTKPFTSPYGGDVVAEDFVGMYLYDPNDKLSKGVTAAMSYRETSLVHALPAAGRYALILSCPRGNGEVPCYLEIVGAEAAKVRLTDPPEGARELSEVDLAFLDSNPEGIDLAALPLSTDKEFQDTLAQLRALLQDPNADPEEIRRLQEALNARAHELAKHLIGSERPIYLPDRDLATLNPVLDASEEYMDAEKERFYLKQDPRKKNKVAEQEEKLRTIADALAQDYTDNHNLTFLDAELEGIPLEDLPLMEDETFAGLMAQRAALLKNPQQNAEAIVDLERQLNERARDIARAMHAQERSFLDPAPEGIPLALLPLDNDEEFQRGEKKLRALRNSPVRDEAKIAALEDKLNNRAHELARELKERERGMFLDPSLNAFASSDAVPADVLDQDADFRNAELRRLQLRQADPANHADEIRALEDAMNARAKELEEENRSNARAFLNAYGISPKPINAMLDDDDEFRRMERHLRALQEDPARNAKAIEALQAQMAEEAQRIAQERRRAERPQYMRQTYRGRPYPTLPLDDDAEFLQREGAYLDARDAAQEGTRDYEEVAPLLDAVHARADELAQGMNRQDRAQFLSEAINGIPVSQLGLEDDATFMVNEEQRAAALARGEDVRAFEDAMVARAEEMARARLASDRAFLDAKPEGIPLALVGVDSDPEFRKLEERRAALRAKGDGDATAAKNIAALEKGMNDRAHELAKQLKQAAIQECVDPVVSGVSREQLPLSADAEMTAHIADRAAALANGDHTKADEAAERMKDRAAELAGARVEQLRAHMDQAPLQVPLSELPLDEDPTFQALEQEALRLQGTSNAISPAVQSVLDQMNDRAKELAEEKLWSEREQCMDKEPAGRALRDLPLNDDEEFMAMEKKRRALAAKPNKTSADENELARLTEEMNARAREIAHDLNKQDRPEYLGRTVRGLPLESLPIDEDASFRAMEEQHAKLARDPVKNADALRALEDEMRARADALVEEHLKSDRAFLDAKPEGIPLALVGVDSDPEFRKLEERRAALRAKGDGDATAAKNIAALEKGMNDRAHELAKQLKQAAIQECVDPVVSGVSREQLPLSADAEMTAHIADRAAALANGDHTKADEAAERMKDRAAELAGARVEQLRAHMDQAPLQVPLSELPLDEDPTFQALEQEALRLQGTSNAISPAVQSVLDQMNDRAKELAEEKLWSEREQCMNKEPAGRALRDLPLNDDEEFMAMEKKRRALAAKPNKTSADENELARLTEEMNARAREIAHDLNKQDRPEYLGRTVRGLPLESLPIDEDASFRAMEEQHAKLARDPVKNADALRALEDEMRARAGALADDKLKGDRAFLDPRPEGVTLRQIPLDDDAVFTQLEQRRAALKAAGGRNAPADIARLEEQMNDRARDMAADMTAALRAELTQKPLGVPLKDLPLDEDRTFRSLEEQHRDAVADGDADAAEKLLAALNDRAEALANELHKRERAVLEQKPQGIPLEALPLNEDEEFLALEGEARDIRKRNPSDARLAGIEDKLNERAKELANEMRRGYCEEAPEGIPLELLDLGSDPAFTQKEAERHAMAAQPVIASRARGVNVSNPADDELNSLARAAARRLITGDRDAYLDPNPEGVPLSVLPLDTDPDFHAKEVERAKLKAQNPTLNQRKIADLERQLNDRAHELALAQKKEDLRGLDPEPQDIPLELLSPHEDPTFAALVDEIRVLKGDPIANEDAIDRVKDAMDMRCDEMAQALLEGDRGYLDPKPEDVPIDILPLSQDDLFHAKEAERAKLKLSDPRRNAQRIKALEDALNDRARELAQAQRREDLRHVDAEPNGIPKEYLGLHVDATAAQLIDKLRELKRQRSEGGAQTAPEIQSVEAALNDRAHQIAQYRLNGDRAYLDPCPAGVPLEDLPLDNDPTFRALEVERAKLKADEGNKAPNAAAIKKLEDQLNQRAYELALAALDEDLEPFKASYEGIPTKDLKPHRDRLFAELAAQKRKHKRQPLVTWSDELERVMEDRLTELAKEKNDGELYFLDPTPEGVPVEDLPLSADSEFASLRKQRDKMKAEDPLTKREDIHKLEDAMNARARELARQELENDFAGMDQKPLGIPLELLKPREDPVLAALVEDLRRARRLPGGGQDRVAAIEESMNSRGHELAKLALDEGRDQYLDPCPEGVPLGVLPLDTDPSFNKYAVDRAVRRLTAKDKGDGRDPEVPALEAQLNERAHELARAQLAEDLKGVDAEPEGVPLALLHPHDDPTIARAVEDVRLLKKDPVRNAEKIKAKQAAMNHRAHELAKQLLANDRGDYLEAAPLGVPLAELSLDTDPAFHALEAERAMVKATGKDRDHVAALEQQLRDRSEELARAQLADDLTGLAPCPLGVPLALLQPHQDAEFAALVPELRRLKKDPARNAAKIKARRDMMDGRNVALAEAFLDADRDRYLDAQPEGLAWRDLHLSDNPAFKELENKKLALQATAAQDPHSSQGRAAAEEAKAVEKQLNEMAHKIASDKLKSDRAYLEAYPEGVALEYLPLDTDPTFHSLEAERALAKAKRNTGAAEALEGRLNERAQELARLQKTEDLKGLHQTPRGVPLAALQPHEDAKFAALVEKLRQAKRKPSGEVAREEEIANLQDAMDQRAEELAEAALKRDRDYLEPHPEHVPLARVPVDSDAAFTAMEGERAAMKLTDPRGNAAKVAEMEGKLNARLRELARGVKAKDLEGLQPHPRDLPLHVVDPHRDAKFSALAEERAALPAKQRADASEPVVQSLNKRADELAAAMLQGDRDYLHRDPEGVSLSSLPLDTDEAFHQNEVQRAILKAQDPKKNAADIRDLEDKLNDRAAELARMVLAQDRSYLDQKPEGVPLAVLPLDSDPKFHTMEMERAKAKARNTPADNERAKELEAKLNERAHELAKKQLAEDLEGLEREPAGYPLAYLKPHHDEVFAGIVEPSLRAAKKAGNLAKVQELQGQLNDRTAEVARKRITEDRAFMNPMPEDVPLELLPLDTDAVFTAAERELRAWKSAVDDKGLEMYAVAPETAAVRDAQDRMDARAHELAKALLHSSRDYLDPEPEGVPIADVPLDNDPTFRSMEVARLRMLGNPKKQDEVARLEEQLNERAHELARGVKGANRSFLNPTSYGVPRELLTLDDDKEFRKGEKELRKAIAVERSHPRDAAAATATKQIKAALQDIADAVGRNQVLGDRARYLAELPNRTGVEIADLNLDLDKPFTDMELERAILVAKDPVANKRDIEKLEESLEARAEELARELIEADRAFLPEDILGIPRKELPLDDDDKFKKLERVRRGHRRAGVSDDVMEEDKENIFKRAEALAGEVVVADLAPMKPTYRNIPVEDLGLHNDDKFRELAEKRRRCRGKGRVNAPDVAAIEDEMDRRACEIADDVVDNERGFLDQEPEGMYLRDVPLDADPVFVKMEAEYLRRSRDPRMANQNKEVLRELAGEMNQRSHALARAEFAKMRDFMTPEPEGIPLAEIGLDEDPEFKEAEIARYRNNRGLSPKAGSNAEMEARMEARAAELARAMLAADRGFLDPEPEGVPLGFLPLDTDPVFCQLARDRRRCKKGLKKGAGEEDVRACEEQMNARCHEMAKDFLAKERAFLDAEPEGVPIADVPLSSDAPFCAMEHDRLVLKKQLGLPTGTAASNADPRHPKLAPLEDAMNTRAHVVAKELLKKERGFLDPEPLGVDLEELPLNHDEELNPVERQRRACRKAPKAHQETIRTCEEKMHNRVNAIAEDFIEKERAFMDQEPEGVPLRYLPLSSDREFREAELRRRKLRRNPDGQRDEISKLEDKMNTRAHALAQDLIRRGRAFLEPEPLGVPIADVPLNGDEAFRRMEEQRRRLKEDTSGRDNTEAVRTLEDRLNDRAFELAQRLLEEERAFMNPAPIGIPLEDLPLNEDRRMRDIERTRRRLRKSDTPSKFAADIKILEDGMEDRALELARKALADNRGFLDPEPFGVPLEDLPLETDAAFHGKELEHFQAKKRGRDPALIDDLENRLNQRAYELAEDFIRRERAYLDPDPEGLPLSALPLDKDVPFHSMELERRRLVRNGGNPEDIQELEYRLNQRAHELAQEIRGWRDVEFHNTNQHVAEEWPRIRELYPEGREVPLLPTEPLPSDVDSAANDVGYLAPFIAALGRHPVLLSRLIATEEHPIHGPYSFVFFDPNSNPVYVDIDDRVPCDADFVPKFTLSPARMWYPLLLEKAYAKFVGGYENLDNCTPHETLRDLTGRPVTHIPFDRKLAEAANIGDYTAVNFWLGVVEDMARGDVILCLSNADGDLDGIHPQCSYALLGVIETVEGTVNPADIVIKLHNAYRSHGPVYNGPLCVNDTNWSDDLRRICRYTPDRDDIIYMPLPTFLRNFSSMQNCHINCGDRLTATGAWEKHTAGGNPKFTTFRNNSIFLVENKSTRPAVVLTELRHNAPSFVDPDGVSHYPQTGLVLMQPTNPSAPPTPLITNSTYKFLQKGMMLDSREVCSVMELPASSVCAIVPYTMRSGEYGAYSLSVYPGMARVALTPLHFAGLAREPTATRAIISPGEEGRRIDFSVTAACEVHVLLRQEKVSESRSTRKGDTIAEDDIVMSAFSDQGTRLASSGDATNAREHALTFKAPQAGRYSLLITSPNRPVSGDCPVTVSVYTPKKAVVKFVAPPIGARPLQQPRLPTLPKPSQTTPKTRRTAPPGGAETADRLPPLKERTRAAASVPSSKGRATRATR